MRRGVKFGIMLTESRGTRRGCLRGRRAAAS